MGFGRSQSKCAAEMCTKASDSCCKVDEWRKAGPCRVLNLLGFGWESMNFKKWQHGLGLLQTSKKHKQPDMFYTLYIYHIYIYIECTLKVILYADRSWNLLSSDLTWVIIFAATAWCAWWHKQTFITDTGWTCLFGMLQRHAMLQ